MRILHFDLSAGVSGDMLLGALRDLGAPADVFEGVAAALGARGALSFREASRAGIRGLRAEVEVGSTPTTRHLHEFLDALDRSRLPDPVRERAAALLRRIFEAEGQIHGQPAERVHLHELGSLDTLVDIVGVVAAIAHLAPDRVTASPVNVGSGSVDAEHGILEVPAPATALLLRGVPTFSDGSGFERATPTGAVLTGLVESFDGWPAFTPRTVGYGLGHRNPKHGRPNALRAVLGTAEPSASATERIRVVEATLDDMQPEFVPHLIERLLASGALDAFASPVSMKKGRPGFTLTALVGTARCESVCAAFFEESTTLGVRTWEVERRTLARRQVRVTTRWGDIGVKLGVRDGRVVNRAPEFEDCRRLAAEAGVAMKDVYREALAAPLPSDADRAGDE